MIWRQKRGPPAMCGIDLPSVRSTIFLLGDRSGLVRAISKDWHLSTVYQVETGFPFTISVFGDTADAGTELGENPIRANVRGSHCFPRELAPPKIGAIARHLTRLPLTPSGMRDAIQFIGRARKRWIWRWSATLV